MPRVNITLRVNGRPLRQAFVEHIVFGAGTRMYLTDVEGRVRDDDFNLGIDSGSDWADIRIICQNPVARVVDGGALNIGVYQDKSGLRDGAVVDLDTQNEQELWYEILNRTWLSYHLVFRHLSYFADSDEPDYPLGRVADLRATKDRPRRVDVSYPDGSVAPVAWVEPKRLGDAYPLVHFKDRATDGRLLGEVDAASNGSRQRPTVIPGELAHALHFGHLSAAQRGRAQDKYLEFITVDWLGGGDSRHSFAKRTTAEVAYIEAADHFAGRFAEFVRASQGRSRGALLRPQVVTGAMRREFVRQQWLATTTETAFAAAARQLPRVPVGVAVVPGSAPTSLVGAPSTVPALAQARNLRQPSVTGGDCEGAVFAAIFVDFAYTVGLDLAASSYFAANAITFGEYREYINDNHPEHAAALEQVRGFWGL